MTQLLPNMHIPPHRLPLLYFTLGATSALLLSPLLSTLTYSSSPKSIPSPLATATASSPSSSSTLPYGPTSLPGARDVSTPYGSIRAYEFGPTSGRKVLLVHGISTPCIALAPMAEKLAEKGCRVLMYDLFGRGYSDGVGDAEYDERVYISQILYVLASSPLSWLPGTRKSGTDDADAGFSIMGYSMGGGIAMAFASYFPALVHDIVLLAPGGLLRPTSNTWQTRLIFSGWLPDALTSWLVGRRLKFAPNVKTTGAADDNPASGEAGVGKGGGAPMAFGRPVDAAGIVSWQLENHKGFLPAFVSSMRFAPLKGGHAQWEAVGRMLDATRAGQEGSVVNVESTIAHEDERENEGRIAGLKLKCGKILMVVGKEDTVIRSYEHVPDAMACLGELNLEVLEVDAGHEVPVTKSQEIVEWVWANWTDAGSEGDAEV